MLSGLCDIKEVSYFTQGLNSLTGPDKCSHGFINQKTEQFEQENKFFYHCTDTKTPDVVDKMTLE